MENLIKFLSPEDKFNQENDLDYMICDDFFSSFSGQTSVDTESLLRGCLAEADALSKSGQLIEAGFGRDQEHKVSKKIRCDTRMWLTSLLKQNDEATASSVACLHKLVQ